MPHAMGRRFRPHPQRPDLRPVTTMQAIFPSLGITPGFVHFGQHVQPPQSRPTRFPSAPTPHPPHPPPPAPSGPRRVDHTPSTPRPPRSTRAYITCYAVRPHRFRHGRQHRNHPPGQSDPQFFQQQLPRSRHSPRSHRRRPPARQERNSAPAAAASRSSSGSLALPSPNWRLAIAHFKGTEAALLSTPAAQYQSRGLGDLRPTSPIGSFH